MVAADDYNRQQFDEAMQVIQLALNQDTFAFHGQVYDLPPPGIPDRGGQVEEAHPRASTPVSVRDLAGDHVTADAGAGAQVGMGRCLLGTFIPTS